VTKYLEIGARHGDTFHYLVSRLPEGSTAVAVDLPGGLWGKESSRSHLERAVADLCKRGYKASCLFGDSQTEATKRLIVGRGPFDAILIDGDHTLPGVTRDWDLYGDMAKIVAFYDIVGTGQAEKVYGNPVEVPILWDWIKHSGLVTVEYVAEGSAMSIGCVLR
jgi:predicted O-methyltransferase YrrM